MKLYHGTNGRWLNNILRHGLEPRGRVAARDNWKHVPHRSKPALRLPDGLLRSVLRVSTPRAARTRSVRSWRSTSTGSTRPTSTPTRTFLEQAYRRAPNAVPGAMSQRTLHYRKRQFDYTGASVDDPRSSDKKLTWWQFSLRELGTCAHRGAIPAAAITRAVVWPYESNLHLAFVWDPSITLTNQRFCGDRYRALTAKLFAGDFTDSRMLTAEHRLAAAMDPALATLPPIEGWRLVDLAQAEAA